MVAIPDDRRSTTATGWHTALATLTYVYLDDAGPDPCGGDDDRPEKVGFEGRPKRAKQKPPLCKRVAKRKRRKVLAKHHKKVMKLAAKAKVAGTRASYPKRPPKPRV